MDTLTNLKSTDVYRIKLGLQKTDGTVDPIRDGETFSVTSTMPAVVPGSIDETDPLNPVLIVNALTLPSPETEAPGAIVLSVNDSGGDTVYELTVPYPVPAAVDSITGDVAGATLDTQPAPTA